MKILVIEDELLVAESLMKIVRQLEPSAELIGPIPTVKASLKWLSENIQPDLILSDIQLADGISLDIFYEQKISCPIIFTTAYNEYAIRAFKVTVLTIYSSLLIKKNYRMRFKNFTSCNPNSQTHSTSQI